MLPFWPLQIVTFGFALVVVVSLWRKWPITARAVPAILAVMWAINAIGYHYLYFRSINPAATLFAALFLVQAILLSACALSRRGLKFGVQHDVRTYVGSGIVIYAMVVYPILGILAGHGLMEGPMLGIAPCPTTIFTIGILVLARGKWIAWLSIVPMLWSLIGWLAAVQLGMPEDFGLPVSAAILLTLVVSNNWLQQHKLTEH
jgi:Family of unknown function (DUF6064)